MTTLNQFARRKAEWHRLRVERLRLFLRMPNHNSDFRRKFVAIKGYYPGHPHLFSVREFADAIGATPKVIRALARSGMIRFECLPNKNSRKLFFRFEAIQRFANRFGDPRALRSEKIALHPEFLRGNAVTLERAALELGISTRSVRYYFDRGMLRKVGCGYRPVLVDRASLARLAWRRLSAAERQFEAARKRVAKIHRFW